MWHLYGTKPGQSRKLVATFDSEQQLKAYVSWATLNKHADGTYSFEQKTPLTSYKGFEYDRSDAAPEDVDLPHNPSPSML